MIQLADNAVEPPFWLTYTVKALPEQCQPQLGPQCYILGDWWRQASFCTHTNRLRKASFVLFRLLLCALCQQTVETSKIVRRSLLPLGPQASVAIKFVKGITTAMTSFLLCVHLPLLIPAYIDWRFPFSPFSGLLGCQRPKWSTAAKVEEDRGQVSRGRPWAFTSIQTIHR